VNYLVAALLAISSQAAIWTTTWAVIQYINRREAEQINAFLESTGELK
jgi:hypothetical protein